MALPATVRAEIGHLLVDYPVDLNGIAEHYGIPVFQADLAEGVSGALVRGDANAGQSGFVCYVKKGESVGRQRFTAAHEIGHFILHRDRIGEGVHENYLLRSDTLSNKQEVEANKFAADLIMPRPLIDRLISEGVTSVKDLARALKVSEVAMAIRLGHPA